jgi:hypothetical protein
MMWWVQLDEPAHHGRSILMRPLQPSTWHGIHDGVNGDPTKQPVDGGEMLVNLRGRGVDHDLVLGQTRHHPVTPEVGVPS